MAQLKTTPFSVTVKGWRMEEQNQFESILCQGNGYLGIRAAAELPSPMRNRGLLIAGCFDTLPGEVSELSVIADLFGLELRIDGQPMTMEQASGYECRLEMETGLLVRRYMLKSRSGVRAHVTCQRMVSLADLHVCAQQISIKCDRDCQMSLTHTLDGSLTNSGAQHLRVKGRRCQPGDHYALGLTANQSGVEVALCAAVETTGVEASASIAMERRTIGSRLDWEARAEESAAFTWYLGVHTSRDAELGDPEQAAIDTALRSRAKGFASISAQSAQAWAKYWEKHDVLIDGAAFDQTAVRFALYHLRVMTPAHDPRMNIGAKGLSGEAYRGHTFWDTEMFMLMPWVLSEPDVARKLMAYRFLCLPSAHEKAAAHGCAGALYPWESAWVEEGEQTPSEGEPDVVTGKPIRIKTGEMEIHVNADVAMGVWRYYEATGDTEFMEQMGWKMLWETGLYWADRACLNPKKQCYEILDVIGPDEYTEPAHNNAYTNHLAHWNMERALEAAEHLPSVEPELLAKVQRVKEGLSLPIPNQNGILPQCDGFLSLPAPDIAPYKGKPGAILKQYNVDQLSQTQIAKQADVIALMTLLPDALTGEEWARNFDYYEPLCLHDSSLSYNTYSLAAAKLGRAEEAYDLFGKAAAVDLNAGQSSVAGIHAAAMGGIWQCAVMGFGGAEVRGGELHLNPCMPKEWKRLSFSLCFKGNALRVTLTHGSVRLSATEPVSLWLQGKKIALSGGQTVRKQLAEARHAVV